MDAAMFKDRNEAGRKLADALSKYRGKEAAVLALPRGGVVIGAEIAQALALPLDIIAVRKIGHPSSPEYAIGAIDEIGTKILNENETSALDQGWLVGEAKRQQKEAARRLRVYRGGRAPVPISGKTAIIVDDGIATGLTMRLATLAARRENPKRIVVAVPVAPSGVAAEFGADDLVVLAPPEEFMGAIGAHYISFPQVSDDEVIRLLERAQKIRL